MQHPELTAERRAELVKLAVKATWGRWRSDYEHVWATGYRVASCDWDLSGARPMKRCFHDAAFIAAANPQTILAYEAALKAKEEEALKLREALEEADDCLIAVDGHTLEPDLAEGWGTAELYDAHMIIRAALSPETSKTAGERG